MFIRWLKVVADPVRLGILRSLSQVPTATITDLAYAGQASNQTLRRHLEALALLGVIDEHAPQSDGQTPGRPATRYSLPAEMKESVRSLLEPLESEGKESPQPTLGLAAVPSSLASTKLNAEPGPMNGARAR